MRWAVAPLLVLSWLACNFPGAATPSPSAPPPATAIIAATAAPSTPTSRPPSPTPSRTAEPEPTPAPLFHLVYVDGGDAWYMNDLVPARRLTDGGKVSEVLLTDDGLLAALVLRDPQTDTAELQVVHTDGTGRLTLMRPADFDRLHSREGMLHITPSMFGVIPGSHTLLFNNRAVFEGPGLDKFDDLFSLDLDSGELTPLLPPGSGGDFWFSPDGSRIALVRPDGLGLIRSDGSDPKLHAFSHLPVITYSEYAFYPRPVWSPDSSLLQVVIPSQDPFAATPGGEVWRIPVDGRPAQLLRELRGDVFRPQLAAALLSPNLAWLAFARATAVTGEIQLVLVSLVDGGEFVYDRGAIQWVGWAPDSEYFLYAEDGGAILQLGELDADPQPLPAGFAVRWLDADRFMYVGGGPQRWSIMLAEVGGAATTLVTPAGASISFDVAPSFP